MNHYAELSQYLLDLGTADPGINVVVMDEDFDMGKSTVYPLMDVAIDSGRFTDGQTVVLQVDLTVVDIYDNNPEVKTDRFYKNDNLVDIFTNTMASLNSIWGQLVQDIAARDITASINSGFVKVEGQGQNNVYGWTLTFDIEMPNTDIKLCT